MHTTLSVSPSAPTDVNAPLGQATPATAQPNVLTPPQPNVFSAQMSNFGGALSGETISPFAKPAAFGQPSFGQPSAPVSSPFGQNIMSGGFCAFTPMVPAKFGQSRFGFGSAGQQEAGQPNIGQSAGASQPSMNTQEEDGMAEDGPILDGLGLGSSNTQDADSKPSILGNTTAQTSSAFQPTGELIKSGTGFGGSGNLDQKNPFANPSAFVTNATSAFEGGMFGSQPAQPSTFGQATFGLVQKPTFGQGTFGQPAFGQPAFGQPMFGQPAFGHSSFGQTQQTESLFGKPSFGVTAGATPASPPTTSSTAGAFSVFVSSDIGGFAMFASKDELPAKPAWAALGPTKSTEDQPKSAFGAPTTATSVFSKPSEPVASKAGSAFDIKGPKKPAASPFAVRESAMEGPKSRSPSPSSPVSPVAVQQPVASPATENKGSGGAFGNLQLTPSIFKPVTGVLGTMPKDSPFLHRSSQMRNPCRPLL